LTERLNLTKVEKSTQLETVLKLFLFQFHFVLRTVLGEQKALSLPDDNDDEYNEKQQDDCGADRKHYQKQIHARLVLVSDRLTVRSRRKRRRIFRRRIFLPQNNHSTIQYRCN